jgi:hypothetical protein
VDTRLAPVDRLPRHRAAAPHGQSNTATPPATRPSPDSQVAPRRSAPSARRAPRTRCPSSCPATVSSSQTAASVAISAAGCQSDAPGTRGSRMTPPTVRSSSLAQRVDELDWRRAVDTLDEIGIAAIGPISRLRRVPTTSVRCTTKRERFRSTIDMARHRLRPGAVPVLRLSLARRLSPNCARRVLAAPAADRTRLGRPAQSAGPVARRVR